MQSLPMADDSFSVVTMSDGIPVFGQNFTDLYVSPCIVML